jgi:hypothetical protein
VVLINQNYEFGIRFCDPGAGVFDAAGILRDGNDFKIFIF